LHEGTILSFGAIVEAQSTEKMRPVVRNFFLFRELILVAKRFSTMKIIKNSVLQDFGFLP